MPILKTNKKPNPEPFLLLYLTKAKFAKVSLCDYDRLAKHKWFAKASFSKLYAARWQYKKTGKQILFMHRFIMSAPKNLVVHHKNGDSLDNRRSNLELMPEYDHIKVHSWR